ncbi:MAG TPA: hypothetical protein VFG20_03120 [Planctomycetaceae bacterium]|nr:hypothetical protein [Planctomycetaceae bacterium]
MLRDFGNLALAIFKEPLRQYGFKRESKKTEKYFCNVVFVNGERYVRITANVHPRDYPPYFNVILGEGPRDFFESDWNSIALWRLKNLKTFTDTGRPYSHVNKENLPELLEHARDELLEFGEDFLSGDVALFHRARSEMNTGREPYKILSNGTWTFEPKSVELKEKNS